MTPADLGIDLAGGDPSQLYRWFLASLLFGKRIQQDLAASTWHVLMDNGLTSPESFASVSRERLMELLTEGGYVHYRWKEDDELHTVMAGVIQRYGSLEQMVKGAGSAEELKQRLEEFKGIGPVTAGIFMEWIPQQYNGTYPG